jgi:pilus assembly protein Flp/PilA
METVASDDGGAGRPPDREVGAYAAQRSGGGPPVADGGIMAHALRYYLDLLALRTGKGQGLVEYALIIVLISIVSILIMTTLGGTISSVFSNANTALTTP